MTASYLLYSLLILALVPFLVSNWWHEGSIVGIVYDIVLALIAISDYLLTQNRHLIGATRHVRNRLSIGRANQVTIYVVNQGNISLKMRLKDNFPHLISADTAQFEFNLPANSSLQLKYNLTPNQRGLYQFGDIHIRYLSLLKLFWTSVTVKSEAKVKVFSDIDYLHRLSVKLSCSELGEMRKRQSGRGTNFASLKEYTSGDDCHNIDWKATARQDRPILRTYEEDKEQNLLILIDAGRMMVSHLFGLSRFDHSLNAALALSLTALTRGDQVSLGIFADKPLLYLPPQHGKSRLKSIVEAVYDIQPRLVEPDYLTCLTHFASDQKGRALIVIFTDLTDTTGQQTLLSGLASLSPRHLPFYVTFKDSQLSTYANDRQLNPDSIYRRATAIDLIGQRKLALSVLARRGCLVLDCAAEELSDRLIEKYLKIKSQGLL